MSHNDMYNLECFVTNICHILCLLTLPRFLVDFTKTIICIYLAMVQNSATHSLNFALLIPCRFKWIVLPHWQAAFALVSSGYISTVWLEQMPCSGDLLLELV